MKPSGLFLTSVCGFGRRAGNSAALPCSGLRMPMVEACSELKSVHQVQQQSTATTLPNTDTHPALKCSDQHNHHSVQPPRRVRDEEVAGSNPVTPTTVQPCQSAFRQWHRVAHQCPE
jgi:hypothetical protein